MTLDIYFWFAYRLHHKILARISWRQLRQQSGSDTELIRPRPTGIPSRCAPVSDATPRLGLNGETWWQQAGGPYVRLTVEETEVWVKDFYARVGDPFKKDVNWSKVARDAKFKTSRLHGQRDRNDVDALAIINLARTYGMSPLEELARIPRWQSLAGTMPSTPTAREILSSLHPRHIFHELGDRLGDDRQRQIELEPWDSYYARFSAWFLVTGGEAAKNRLAEVLQIGSPSTMSARLNDRIQFEVDDILDGFIPAGMDPVFALVLAGWITDKEAGYAPTLRLQTLVSVHVDQLLYMMQKQMRFTVRLLGTQKMTGAQRHGEHGTALLD